MLQFDSWYALVLSCPFVCVVRWEPSHLHFWFISFLSILHPSSLYSQRWECQYMYILRFASLRLDDHYQYVTCYLLYIQPLHVDYNQSIILTLYPHHLCSTLCSCTCTDSSVFIMSSASSHWPFCRLGHIFCYQLPCILCEHTNILETMKLYL